jgi:membrane-associated phospholipid phosphatase
MVVLFAIVPLYIFIGENAIPGRTVHAPEIALDRALPLVAPWSIVYGSLFLAVLLPVFVVHQQELVRRTIAAYLAAWVVSLAVFLAWPTVAPRHAQLVGGGFAEWALHAIWASDVRYNCFPSLHVAQSFLAAFACHRVHRGVGAAAFVWASLVGISTLYTKQHYFLDVIAGALLAGAAYGIFIRGFPREATPALERRMAPVLAAGAFATYGAVVGAFLVLYALGF